MCEVLGLHRGQAQVEISKDQMDHTPDRVTDHVTAPSVQEERFSNGAAERRRHRAVRVSGRLGHLASSPLRWAYSEANGFQLGFAQEHAAWQGRERAHLILWSIIGSEAESANLAS